jgi:hypothetical protein
MQKKTVIEMEYGELEKLIEKTYGFEEYSIPAEEEKGNECSLTFNLVKDEEINEWDKADLEKMKTTKKPMQYRTHLLMQDMCNNGVLEPGDYVVKIFW